MAKELFFKELEKFSHDHAQYVQQADEIIQKHKQQLQRDLFERLDKSYNFQVRSPLAKEFQGLQSEFKSIFQKWDIELNKVIEAQYLAKKYQNRIIFLVYGKVNAGKSSFCNFIASIFDSDQIERFTVRNGQIEPIKDKFKEGCIETTASIQGVTLGENFLLLDSPGLHSVTPENGQVTQDFIDCTDAVLWLTPSGSPGQIDELRDLQAELSKEKPLLPLITGSDYLEEDEDSGDEYFVNKSAVNRAKQEKDVYNRLKCYIEKNQETIRSLLRTPLSISLFAYQESKQLEQDFEEAGLKQLLNEMTKLIHEASAYKLIKNQQQAQNFLKGKIVRSIDEIFIERLNQVMISLMQTTDKLDQQERHTILTVQSEMQLVMDKLIQKHSKNKDKKQLVKELNNQLNRLVNKVLSESLGQLMANIKQVSHELLSETFKDFEDETLEIEQVKGKVLSKATGIAGVIVSGLATGALAGTVGAGPVGTVVGGLLGAIVGGIGADALGEQIFVETETIKEVVGVNSVALDQSLNQYLKSQVPSMIKQSFNDIREELNLYSQNMNQILDVLDTFKKNIEKTSVGIKNVA